MGHRLGPDDAGKAGPVDHHNRRDDRKQARPDDSNQQDREENRRKSHPDVDKARHNQINPAAIKPRQQPKRCAQTGRFRPHGTESTRATGGREIDVQPWLVTDKQIKKARRQGVICFAIERALLNIGHLAFQRTVIVIRHRKSHDTFTRRLTGHRQLQRIVGIRRKKTAHPVAQGHRHTAREGGEINHDIRICFYSERQRIRQHHAAFGIRMHDLDRESVHGRNDVTLTIRRWANVIAR